MTEGRHYYEADHLSTQIANARALLADLEARARAHGLHDLLTYPDAADEMFELEAVRALAGSRECER